MKQDRIQINGVWYVRDDKVKDNYNEIPKDIIEEIDDQTWKYKGVFYEGNLMVLDTSISDDSDLIMSIKYIDKTVEPWAEDSFDNDNWLRGVLENNPESIPDFEDAFETHEKRLLFKAYLLKLKNMGYL
jgi:homospermidine synthase